jgi:2-polyprenyl-3-methyl-5-hydroxy-6-metoxy-1,4-benzoquinol methylase
MENKFNFYIAENFYDKYATEYQSIRLQKGMLFNDYIELPAVMNEIQKMNLKPETTLDIGCGAGFYTKEFANQSKQVTALDVSSEMLKIAKKYCSQELENTKYNNIEFMHSSLERSKLIHKYYDLVLGTFMLGYFKDLNIFFKKIKYTIKRNGKLIVSSLHPIRLFSKRNKDEYCVKNYFDNDYYESDFISSEYDTLKLKRWTIEEITSCAFDNGFLIEKILEPKPILDIPIELKQKAEFYKHNPSILIIVLRSK